MPAKLYKVALTNEERAGLTALVTKGTGNVRRIRRAQKLLFADENQPDGAWKDADIAKVLRGCLKNSLFTHLPLNYMGTKPTIVLFALPPILHFHPVLRIIQI